MSQYSAARAAAAAALLAMLAAGAVHAQSMSASSAGYEAGYGRTLGQENRPVDPNTRDANGNRVIVDGVIQTGADQSVYARSGAWGAADAYAGAGSLGGSTAIGNNLVVVTQGSWNTVVVDSTQINNGDVTATSTASAATATASASARTAAKTAKTSAVASSSSAPSTLGGGVGDLNGELNLDGPQ
jgi:holdfast attachment protein HfaA